MCLFMGLLKQNKKKKSYIGLRQLWPVELNIDIHLKRIMKNHFISLHLQKFFSGLRFIKALLPPQLTAFHHRCQSVISTFFLSSVHSSDSDPNR